MTLRQPTRPGALLASAVALALAGWGCGMLARAYAGPLDLRAVSALAAVRTPALTAAARALSAAGSGYVVLPLAAAVAVTLALSGCRRPGVVMALCGFGAVALSSIDKALVDRPRPPLHHLEHVTSGSFPSGHATQSTGVYLGALLAGWLLVRARRDPSRGRAALIAGLALVGALVCAIAWSRIYLAVHYPTDVAGGILLGAGWVTAVGRALAPARASRGGTRDRSPTRRRPPG